MEKILRDKYESPYFYNHEKAPAARHFSSVQPHRSSTVIPSSRHDIKDTKSKSTKSNTNIKNTERDFTFSPIIKCYNCQG